jgi:hypothetical protein
MPDVGFALLSNLGPLFPEGKTGLTPVDQNRFEMGVVVSVLSAAMFPF